MVRSHQIFFEGSLLVKLISIVEASTDGVDLKSFKSEIRGMLKHKEIRIIQNKYDSKFDSDELIADLL